MHASMVLGTWLCRSALLSVKVALTACFQHNYDDPTIETPKGAVRAVTLMAGQVVEVNNNGCVTLFGISQTDLQGIPSWIVGLLCFMLLDSHLRLTIGSGSRKVCHPAREDIF